MFIKSVKDAAENISKNAQQTLARKVDQLSQFTGGRAAMQSLVMANDGSLYATNLKRVMSSVCAEHFAITEEEITNMSLGRMEASIVEGGRTYSMLIIIADDQENKLKNLCELVRKVKGRTPSVHILVFTPYDTSDNKAEDLIENMNAIRDYAMLINTAIIDYTNASRLTRFLREIAPV